MGFIIALLIGDDGFTFTSVSPGTHTVTVIGTLDGVMTAPLTITSLMTTLPLTLFVSENVQGTTVTLTISANQAATFECQLDGDPNFVPCKKYTERVIIFV